MDKTIPEWLRRFRGMKPEQMYNAWESKAKVDLTWTQECNFHAAAAERMKQLGNMAIDLDDKTREKLCQQADDIIKQLQRHLKNKPEQLAEIDAAVQEFKRATTKTLAVVPPAIICSSKA